VPALAVYAGDFAPIAELRSPADVAGAERQLFAALRKSVAQDGAVAFHVMRPLARLATHALVGTPVTPNQVTLAALALGLCAAGAAVRGAWAAAGALIWLAAVIDCIDGDLARLRIEGSRRGEWLDSIADELSTFALLVALGVRLGLPALGMLGALLGTATAAKLYSDLDRLNLPIDTAQYPWFFGKPSDRTPPARGLARAVYLTSFLFQRDAYLTVVALALCAGAPSVAFFSLFGGIAFLTLLLLVHTFVIHASPSRH
jgi:phosphatidylglycerophosphate synthase